MKVYTILLGKLYQRGKTNNLSITEKQIFLENYDVKYVYSLCSKPDEDWNYFVGSRYIHTPVTDGRLTLDCIKILEGLADNISIELCSGAVLVYCEAGRNRSSLLNAMVVRNYCNVTNLEAVEHIYDKRPNAFGNFTHIDYLIGLDL